MNGLGFIGLLCVAIAAANGNLCRNIMEGNPIDPAPLPFDVNKCYECNHTSVGLRMSGDSSFNAIGSMGASRPEHARLDNTDTAWCAVDDSSYLEISFGKAIKVGSLNMQGWVRENAYVKSVRIEYQKQDGSFEFVKESSDHRIAKSYPANIDCTTVSTISFLMPIHTATIRIHPVTFHHERCFRVDVNGCSDDDVLYETPGKLSDYRNYRANRPTCEYDVTQCNPKCAIYKKDYWGCPTCDCVPGAEISEDEKFEGDILLTQQTVESVQKALNPAPVIEVQAGVQYGAGAANVIRKWNIRQGGNVIVPYTDSRMDSQGRSALQQAIADFNRYTCIRLKRRTTEPSYIDFFVGGGCYSPVGMSGSRNQVSIGQGCQYKGTVIHETMHSLGFWHEQSRPDRDGSVTIQWSNIPSSVQYNFQKYSNTKIDSMGFAYDLGSVMHYSSYAFSSNGRPTITDKRGNPFKTQRNGMSLSDYQQINRMYGCSTTGTGETTTAPPGPTGCVDENQNCAYWAARGECSKNPSYMLVKCKKSCQKCDEVTPAPPTTTTTTRRTRTTRATTAKPPPLKCVDQKETCSSWAGFGLCDYPVLDMKTICPISCKNPLCMGKTTTTPTPTTKSGGCKDLLSYCPAYKDQCTTLSSLLYWCKKTCNQTC